MSKKRRTFDVFVGNLPPSASEKSLSPLFTELGEVNAIIVKNGKKNDGTRIASEGTPSGQQNLGGFATNAIGRSGNQRPPTVPRAQYSPPCSDESIVVCHVKDVTSFYGQRLADVVRLNKLNNDLEEFCCIAPRLCTETPDFQKMYGCQYSDDKAWYRCKVLKQLDNGHSFVQYVDFGNCETVKSTEMVPLRGELASQDPLALCFRLDGLSGIRRDDDPSLYGQAMREIGHLLQEQCVCVQMKRATVSGIHFLVRCQLERSGVDLADELVRRGYAKVVGTQLGIQAPYGGGMQLRPLSGRRPPGWHSQGPSLGPMWTPRVPSYHYPYRQELLSCLEYSTANTRAPAVRRQAGDDQRGGNHPPGKRNVNSAQLSQQQGKPNEVPQVRVLKPDKHARGQEEQPDVKQLLEEEKNCRADSDFLLRMSKIVKLVEMAREQRNQLSVDPLHTDAIQRAMAAYAACKETARAVLNSSQVEDSWARFQKAQDSIRQCKDKDAVGPLVEERNSARVCLEQSLTCFVIEADRHQGGMVPPGGDVNVALAQKALEDLDSVLKPFLDGVLSDGLSLEKVYEHIKNSLEAEFRAKRTETDIAEERLRQSLQSLAEAICVSGKKVGYSFGYLEACLSNLQHSLSEEVASCNPLGSSSPLSLITWQLKKELGDILERISDVARQRAQYVKLLESLAPFPRSLVLSEETTDVASEWAHVAGLLKELQEKRRTVRQLKSQLRHSLADMEDIESCTSSEWKEAVEAVQNLREQVLSAFAEEDSVLSQVTTLREKHFPELSLLYPELEIDAYLAYKGLVKSSWELCAFQTTRLLAGNCFKTSYCGTQVTIKEHVVESQESRQVFLSKAVEWSLLCSQYLVPLKAAFISKDGHKVYLMSPWQQSSTLASYDSPSKEFGGKLLQATLGSLATLHSAGIVHGGVQPSSILVPAKDENVPLLDVPYFAAHLGESGTLNGMDLRAPELRVSGARPTPEGDMYALGCTLLWLCFPRNRFNVTTQGTPSFVNLHKPQMENAILKLSKDLLKSDPKARPKATQLFSSASCIKHDVEAQTVGRGDPKIQVKDVSVTSWDTSDSSMTLSAVKDVSSTCPVSDINAVPSPVEDSVPDASDDTSGRKLSPGNNWANVEIIVEGTGGLSEAPLAVEEKQSNDITQSSNIPDQVARLSNSSKDASGEQLFSSKDVVEPFINATVSETLHSLDLELDAAARDLKPIDSCPVHLGSGDSTDMGALLLQRALACDSSDSSDEALDYVACSAPGPHS